jgi:lipopolysaccharide biosynthesis protein
VDGLSQAIKAVTAGPLEALPVRLDDLWQISNTRLEILSEAEREQLVPHGQVTWSARRALRRMLEHHWEHLLEISDRLEAGK